MKKTLFIISFVTFSFLLIAQKSEKILWGDSLFIVPNHCIVSSNGNIVVLATNFNNLNRNGVLFETDMNDNLSYYIHPNLQDTITLYYHITQLENSNYYVVGVKKKFDNNDVYPILISTFDTALNLLSEKQFYLPEDYVGNYFSNVQESSDTLLFAFKATRLDTSGSANTELGLLRIKSDGDTIQTKFHKFYEGKWDGDIEVFNITKIPNSEKYIVTATVAGNQVISPPYKGIIINPDLSIDTVFSYPNPEDFYSNVPYRANLGYWVDDNSFIVASNGFLYGKSDKSLYAAHYDLSGNLLNSVTLNQEEFQDQSPSMYTSTGANDTTIYVAGHDMCAGCNPVTSTAILEVYTLDASLNVLGYNVIEDNGFYKSIGVTTDDAGDLIIYAVKNVGDTYHSNMYIARIPREELGLAVSVNNIPKAKHESLAYPNPANEIIHFPLTAEFMEKGVRIEIRSLSGKTALNRPVQGIGNNIEINLKNLPEGTYLFQIFDRNKVLSTGKFIKN